MKLYLHTFFTILLTISTGLCSQIFAQNIQVSETAFTPQQLIEDILINSGCITNIQITNTVSGNFNDGSLSYGYFNANGSTFPFTEGVVLSTGKLSNVEGPNTTLSDDDAPGWNGDTDLEVALGISNTTNATILEFDFIPTADNIRFRYIFASEEYQEGDPNTCRFSDAFAFLIRPTGGQYENIALVPGTNTPVLVTTVHPEIPGGCPAINETYFGSFNDATAPINFNGQTAILTAETSVVPNQSYQIKLVLADEENFRFDSAVFLEAESFNIGADLGQDKSFVRGNPLCFGETTQLDATPVGATPFGYTWFRNGTLLMGEIMATYDVVTAGIYSVEIDYGGGCIAFDEVQIDYSPEVRTANTELFQCEEIADGIAQFNLFDVSETVTLDNGDIRIENFYERRIDAEIALDPIPNPTEYVNPTASQIVYARIEDEFGCFGLASVILRTTDATFGPYFLSECSEIDNATQATFDLSEATTQIEADVSTAIEISYHSSFSEVTENANTLPLAYTNVTNGNQSIYARISGMLGCEGIAEIVLTTVPTPQFEPQEPIFYCIDTFPETIEISSGVLGNPSDYNYLWATGETTSTISINEGGSYTVDVTIETSIDGQLVTCTATNTIVVDVSELAQIDLEVTSNYGNNSIITVTVNGIGAYEYAIDGATNFYQESNIFTNVLGGLHTVYVRDKNGCGIAVKEIYVLDFPQVLTPNNDGFHDTWNVTGFDTQNPLVQRIEIFDRYGKLLKVISPTSSGWDGTYNGNPLPSNDYWFVAHFLEAAPYRSHFTLKR